MSLHLLAGIFCGAYASLVSAASTPVSLSGEAEALSGDGGLSSAGGFGRMAGEAADESKAGDASAAKANYGVVTLRKSEERGHADHGWLNTYHTFSFASYYDPKFDNYGPLRVINEDRVAGGTGFGTHPHSNFEIWSYVLSGRLRHKDSMENTEVISRGDVQFTSAGSGIRHSEYNDDEDEEVHFLQIWAVPLARDTTPRYETKHFSDDEKRNTLKLIVDMAGEDKGAITIGQDLSMYASLLDNGAKVAHTFAPGRRGYVHVPATKGSKGLILNGDTRLAPGDGAFIKKADAVTFEGVAEEGAASEFVFFDLK